MQQRHLSLAIGLLTAPFAAANHSDNLKAINSIGAEGAGNEAAARAWKELSAGNATALLPILQSLNGASDLSANWLRSAVETIAARELAAGRALPVGDLEKFLLDPKNHGRARRLAFELIARVDAPRSERLVSGFLRDPALELRRDAVSREIEGAKKLEAATRTNEAKVAYAKLLPDARDPDQVDGIVKELRKLGETPDVAKTFGFITEWKVVGPFDSTGGKGLAAVYPPEQGVNLADEYDGKAGKVRWRDFASKDDHGSINMNLPYTQLKAAAAYAVSDFYSERTRPVELRLASKNAFKIWLNGKYLFGHDEYHRNKAIDQYPIPAELKAGRNEILVKVCQNEQKEDWATDWDFHLRICDPVGEPIVSAPAPIAKQETSK